ncbi:Protein REVEILLE like [Heracleum sosnowskyi]|uniref:Protein REVEILLE like n=1 Tax=Heracleum sosnowskyi TaxID=360622 RepID=A0AAD8I0F0_9APIA|nr:Protein REVEILLE like [Heracleum sosnowskyi]
MGSFSGQDDAVMSTVADMNYGSEDPNSKKIRKPYTITKSRETWTDHEHDKFIEALHLFDRDWKKIEAFVGSKTVIQIRSHAQKYFQKVQKNGTSEHVPPPRPKRKAAHPYPQKAPKNASQVTGGFQSSAAVPGFVATPNSLAVPMKPISISAMSSWNNNIMPPVNAAVNAADCVGVPGPNEVHNSSYSSHSNDPKMWPTGETMNDRKVKQTIKVMPDFAQVYSFIGSVFDSNASGHIERLKMMDPINIETILMLMKNLAVNLTSPEFEDQRRLILSYDPDTGNSKSGSSFFDKVKIGNL